MDHAHVVLESSSPSSLTGISQPPSSAIANDAISPEIKLECKDIKDSHIDNIYTDSVNFPYESLNSDVENKCKITDKTNTELPAAVINKSICDTSSSPTPDETSWTSYINDVNSSETETSIVEIELTEMKQRKSLSDDPLKRSSEQDELGTTVKENSCAALEESIKPWTVMPINLTESVKNKYKIQDNNSSSKENIHDEVSYGNPTVLTFSSKTSNSAQCMSSIPDRHKLNIGPKECTIPTYAMDINGNLCQARNGSFSLVTSSSKYDPRSSIIYPGQSLKSDSLYRKTKKTRTENRNFILSENIAGHKGEVEIDELLNFIQSSDKKGKATNKVSPMTPGQASFSSRISPGNKVTASEFEKKKQFSKDINNGSFKKYDSAKREEFYISDENKHSFSKSDECQIDTINHRSISDFPSLPPLMKEKQCSDWSSSVEDEEQKASVSLSSDVDSNCATLSDDASVCHGDKIDNEVSSFVRDFYAVTDPEQQTEEPEFRVVAKKQRKRQPKRLDSYRRYNNSSGTDGNEQYHTINQRIHNTRMFLANTSVSHRSHLRRLESLRRKSTSSSMPPSEQSSADNSDLDSVHSLPVGKSNTTTSLTPQASYAEIARMPTAILHKSRGSSPYTYSTANQAMEKDETTEIDFHDKDDDEKILGKEYVFENTAFNDSSSSSDQNSDVNNSVSSLVILDVTSCESNKEPIKDLPADAKMQSSCVHNISTNSVTETADSSEINVLNYIKTPADKKTSPTNASNIGDSCEVTGGNTRNVLIRHKSVSSTKHLPAVVIMDNCLPSGNLCGVSFGFDIDEVLKHGAGTIPSCTFVDEDKENSKLFSSESDPIDNKNQPVELVKRAEVMYIGHSHPKCAQTACVQRETGDFSVSSPFIINGRCLIWKDSETDINSFNYAKTVGFLDTAWREALQDYQQKSTDSRVKYYSSL